MCSVFRMKNAISFLRHCEREKEKVFKIVSLSLTFSQM